MFRGANKRFIEAQYQSFLLAIFNLAYILEKKLSIFAVRSSSGIVFNSSKNKNHFCLHSLEQVMRSILGSSNGFAQTIQSFSIGMD